MQKNGLSIVDLAQKIQDNRARKTDYIVPTKGIMVRPNEIEVHDVGTFQPTDHFHRQVSAFTDIPWKYYDRIRSRPELFAHNVNTWLGDKDSRRMVRTMAPPIITTLPDLNMEPPPDENLPAIARAFMSDKFRRIDNENILESVLPPLQNVEGCQVLTCQVTDKMMYLMFAFVKREAEVVPGDVVQAGLIIKNSEIGMSRFVIQPYVHRLWCRNGAVVDVAGKDYGLKMIHAGKRIDSDDNMIAYRNETLQLDDQVLGMKMEDIVTSLATGPMWDDIVKGLKSAAVSTEVKQPIEAVQEVGKVCKLSETETNSVLTNLIKNGDLTRWGMGNAITSVANDIDDGEVGFDRATELQEIGGRLFMMPEREWNRIAEAA